MGLSNYVPNSRISQAGVVADTADRPASPYEGQVLYQRDTNQLLVWDGSAWVAPNSTTANPPGLELVKSQTIGTAVSSVPVNDVFNATYDNYLITVNGGTASTANEIRLQLGSTTSGYYYQLLFGAWGATPLAEGSTTAANFPYTGHGITDGLQMFCHVFNPNKTIRTTIMAPRYANSDAGNVYGMIPNTTQYTGFTLVANTGTWTGGTIRVYGYRN